MMNSVLIILVGYKIYVQWVLTNVLLFWLREMWVPVLLTVELSICQAQHSSRRFSYCSQHQRMWILHSMCSMSPTLFMLVLLRTRLNLLNKCQTETLFQISGLHVYHHSAMLLLSDYGRIHSPWPAICLPLCLNSVVHIFLYAYYWRSTQVWLRCRSILTVRSGLSSQWYPVLHLPSHIISCFSITNDMSSNI